LTQFRAVLVYLRLFLVPVGQNADHEFSISRTIFEPGTALALLALLAGVVFLLKQAPLVRYGGLLFLAFLAPTSSVVPLADVFSEHRMYLPIVGLAVALSARLAQVSVSNYRVALVCTFLSAIAFLATVERARVWSNGVAFWQDVVEKSPRKARAYQHLTHAYVTTGRCDEAVSYLEKAKDIVPRDYFTYVNWAQAYACTNQADAALEKLREAEKMMPTAFVYGAIADSLIKLGRTTEAEQALAMALSKEPPGTDLAHVYQGNLALLANNRTQAEEEYRRAVALNPYSPEAATLLRRLDPETGRNTRSRNGVPVQLDVRQLPLPGQFVDRRMP
jgi:tetratricopeptide (TPR) repeat protein